MHRSARSSRTRVSSSPPSASEVAMASPTSPSQAASSSLVSTAIYTSSVSTPQLVASTLASTSSALPSHLYASSLLASPIFPARVASPSLAPALPAMAVPVQRQPGPTSTFQSGNFPQTPLVPAPSMGPYVGSSSHLPPAPQWPATTPGFQPHSASFPPGQTQQVIIPGTPSLFPSNYPVAGPGSVLPGSFAPGYGFSPGASAFPAANFPPFVVGPGIPPVAPKIVAAIVSGEFIELASLLEDRIEPEPPSFTLIADQLVIRPTKRRKAITDILSWMQAFAVYTLVVTAYYPARVADLLKYQLLIMRTAQQFSGSAWLSYDRAFRRQAAAYKLTDWSQLNPELFHFYVSGCVSVEHPTAAPPVQSVSPTKPSRLSDVMEASGTPSSSTLCHSWNAGRCSSQFLRCRFRHSCDFPGCSALHRRVVAHRKAANLAAPEPPFKRRRPSDA